MQMSALVAYSRLIPQLQRYPAEALASLCHSVREDELDARRATQRICPTRGVLQLGLKTGWRDLRNHACSRTAQACVWRFQYLLQLCEAKAGDALGA